MLPREWTFGACRATGLCDPVHSRSREIVCPCLPDTTTTRAPSPSAAAAATKITSLRAKITALRTKITALRALRTARWTAPG